MDPRVLPDLGDPENDELAADYEVELDRLNVLIEMFDSIGWAYFATSIKRDQELAQARMEQEDKPGAWKFLRGKEQAIGDILSLPDRVRAQRQRVLEDYRRLIGQEEE
jgi:hypothetical protein